LIDMSVVVTGAGVLAAISGMWIRVRLALWITLRTRAGDRAL
jgi:hypothetical protein